MAGRLTRTPIRRPPFGQALLVVAAWLVAATAAHAHEVRPGYLELTQTGPDEYDVLWKVPAKAGNLRLSLDVRFPAGTEITAPHARRFVADAHVDRWSIRLAGGLDGRTLQFDGLRATLTDVLVRVERLDGTSWIARVEPSDTVLTIEAQPGLGALAGTYFILGVEHILLGIDHLLFVLSLVLLVRGTRRLVGTITAFTVAHSLTLAAATLGWTAVPGAPVEAVIALSIVFVAAEIVRGEHGRDGLTARAPWLVALSFGLLHGFGFAGALEEIGLPGHAIPLALLLFNVGVEVGQLVFLAAALLVIHAGRRLLACPPRPARLATAYTLGAVAAWWTLERIGRF